MATEASSKAEREAEVLLSALQQPIWPNDNGLMRGTATIHDVPTAKKILTTALLSARRAGIRSVVESKHQRN